ncbi:hypothetical protein JCM18899A_37560 [Nocardioides sp. AN3]
MDLGPQPQPAAEPAELEPGGPDAPGHEPSGVVRDIRAAYAPTHSDDAGGMGVSSERIGHTGPGQRAASGVKDTSVEEDRGSRGMPPEQRPGQRETNPEGLEPRAGYPSLDPRSTDRDQA